MNRLRTLPQIHAFAETIMVNVFAEQLPENVKITVTLSADDFILLVKDNRFRIGACDQFDYNGVPGCKITIKT